MATNDTFEEGKIFASKRSGNPLAVLKNNFVPLPFFVNHT